MNNNSNEFKVERNLNQLEKYAHTKFIINVSNSSIAAKFINALEWRKYHCDDNTVILKL